MKLVLTIRAEHEFGRDEVEYYQGMTEEQRIDRLKRIEEEFTRMIKNEMEADLIIGHATIEGDEETCQKD